MLFMGRRASGLCVIAIVIVAVGAWADGLSGPFVFDDRPAILANPTLAHFATALFPPHDGGTVAGRPLLNLSLWLNHAISGTAVWSYHVLNLAIHVGAALALFGLVRRTLLLRRGESGDPRARSFAASSSSARPTSFATHTEDKTEDRRSTGVAFVAALVWAVHPLQTAAVTYTVQRAEAFAGLCLLLTLYAFARAVECEAVGRRGGAWFGVSVLACVAGMATKEVMVVAPVLVLFYDIIFAGARRWRFHLVLASTWLLLFWLVVINHGRAGTAGFGARISPLAYLLTQFAAVTRYLRLALWPNGLVFDYGMPTITGVADVAVPFAIIVMLLAGTIVLLWRAPRAGFLGAAFFLLLAPSSSVVPIATQTIAEHRMYLPLAALTVGGALALSCLLPSRGWVVGLVLALPLAAGVHVRNRDYATAVALWSDTVAKRPENARAHTELANALALASRPKDALPQYEAAVRLAPGDPWTHNNYGNALAAADRRAEAFAQYEAALRLDPHFAPAELNYAQALTRGGRPVDAIPHFAAAEKLAGLDAASQYNYGVALAQTRRFAEAIDHFRATLRDQPAHVGALVNLGNALLLTGKSYDAIAAYESALRVQPDDPQIIRNLAQARALAR
jgi:Tfp pilus assembly protein PilF